MGNAIKSTIGISNRALVEERTIATFTGDANISSAKAPPAQFTWQAVVDTLQKFLEPFQSGAARIDIP